MTGINSDLSMSDGEFSKLCAIVHKNTGITIAENRKSMLISRLRGRLREVDESSFATYITRLAADPGELQELTNRVTTNETYFYRTPRIWSYFCETVLPDFHDKRYSRPMRVWSAAASSGEEAHTIGVMLEEERLSRQGFDYSVLGSDVSSRVLKTAETGLYSGRAISRFRKERLELFEKHMFGTDIDGFQVNPEIKRRISFRIHNLVNALSHNSDFDAIFLRNVLIYFSAQDQERILRFVHDKLSPSGVLFIGESESLKHIKTNFLQVEPFIYRPTSKLDQDRA